MTEHEKEMSYGIPPGFDNLPCYMIMICAMPVE